MTLCKITNLLQAYIITIDTSKYDSKAGVSVNEWIKKCSVDLS